MEGTLMQERVEDRPQVRDLLIAAFGRDEEADLVERLRASSGFIPELSVVFERDAEVLGHILFTSIDIVDGDHCHPALSLAPVAVRPDSQRRGIGSALVRRGLDECRRLGHGVVHVLGHPSYYPRFGFARSSTVGIRTDFPNAEEASMVIGLLPGALEGVKGVVRYPPAFGGI